MTLNANKVKGGGGKSKFEPVEPGTYPGRLVQVIDLGLQPGGSWQGEEKPPANKISVTYELSDEFLVDEDGNEMEDKPRWQSEMFPFFSLKADKAKSTKRYLALDPQQVHGGDWSELLGTPCEITLVHNPKVGGGVWVNVAGISAMTSKKAGRLPELVNPTKVFSLDSPDMEVFAALPEFLQDIIKGNLEFNGSLLQKALGDSGYKNKIDPDVEPGDEDEDNEGKPW